MARPRSDISGRIVKAARGRFLTAGVDGASLREIAADARTSVGMVSYYFPSKDDLFLAVVEQIYPRLLGDIRELLGHPGSAQERIAAGFARMQAMSDDEFAVVRIILREALVSSQRLQKIFERFTRESGHVPLVLGALARGIAEGAVREDLPPAALVVATMGLGMAPVILRRLAAGLGLGGAVPSPEEAARIMSGVLFEGIGAPKRAARRRQVKRSLR